MLALAVMRGLAVLPRGLWLARSTLSGCPCQLAAWAGVQGMRLPCT